LLFVGLAMPSSHHQGLVAVFRDDPTLAFDLLRSVFGLELPDFERVYDRQSELDRFAPCFGDTGELRPDLALSGEEPRARQEDVHRGAAMIIEVQKKVDPIKRWRLWVYWALLAERLRLSTAVLCVPMSDAVARWARSLGALEIPGREALLVLDRQNMPRVTELEEARRRPAMAVLSALIHGPAGDIEVVRVAFAVSLELEDDRRWRYASAILSVVPDAEQEALKRSLTMEERYELSEAERNSMAYHDGLRDGRVEGKLEGRVEGKLEGRVEGKLEGKLEGLVELVLTVLELRAIPLDEQAEARIRGCEDPRLLERWAERAKRAESLAGVF
jgi:hypothetical protein